MQNKIIDYTIVQGQTDTALMIQVIKHLKAGWQPQGGVHAGQSYTQAMVKFEK